VPLGPRLHLGPFVAKEGYWIAVALHASTHVPTAPTRNLSGRNNAAVSERTDRIARNEALFRAVNERVAEVSQHQAAYGGEFVDFLCECGDDECVEAVALTLDEYETLRSVATRFALSPGHEALDVETVVARNERFFLVEKHGGESGIAEATDPRT
jgi:hypothetical protein